MLLANRLPLELEQVLRDDLVALHPLDLSDVRDLPRAVTHPVLVHDDVERVRDLLANRVRWQLRAGHQHHRLQPGQAVSRAVRVCGGERSLMPRVHRLQHVQRLAAAHLTNDDAVGTHAQSVAHEIADGDLSRSLEVRGTALEPEHVLLLKLKLRSVLYRDDPFTGGDEAGQHIERGSLTRTGAAGDDDVELALNRQAQEVAHLLGEGAEADQVFIC